MGKSMRNCAEHTLHRVANFKNILKKLTELCT